MRAFWKDRLIAESDNIVSVDNNSYFPADSVDATLLRHSDHTSVCPWKGTAHYHSIVVDDAVNQDAAWFYPDPKPAAAEIRNRIAFWKGVKIVA